MLSFGLPIGFAILVGLGVAVVAVAYVAILSRRKASAGFPVLPAGPGRFRVSGVDRASKLDRVWDCDADTPEKARQKAELEGIAVARVDRV